MLNKQDEKTIEYIAAKIRSHRLKKNLKQIDVANKADLNGNYYSKVERGEARLSVITLGKILQALKIKSSEILPF